ncbi:MAG TPA: glucose-6-phosphate isomerase [Polyangia bacterium]|jgi:glucose-6-phosphate isomerase
MTRALWDRYREYLTVHPSINLSLDPSRMKFSGDFLSKMEPAMQKAFAAMDALEAGAIANPDEKRMVGHYWLRDSAKAPSAELRGEIDDTLARIKKFAGDVHNSRVRGEKGHFLNLLVIGIGGSALGPEFVHAALGTGADRMKVHFFDNTDPDGFDRVLVRLDGHLDETLTCVISKSGGTKETRNGMLEAQAAYEKAGLDFGKHAVAVTGAGSELDRYAVERGFIARFPMWDWVGGRTSELSAVGLLPAALQGIDIQAMLDGARACDAVTRVHDTRKNPAAMMALCWYWSGHGKGEKDMVILPYKDRLELFSRYLQQLVMESLGKEKDLDGKVVHQGIAVYGNKGSTDQHAYVQQLREGVLNFFVTFIEVLQDRGGKSPALEADGATAGDFLAGFLLGTRSALYENDRQSITLTIDRVDARAIGVLIALYERTVGLYASLVNINAYHQPGVEAGKKAAGAVLALQQKILKLLGEQTGKRMTVDEIAEKIGAGDDIEHVFKILEHAAANPDHGVTRTAGATPFAATYGRA